ncbi:flagellar motor protein [Alicyclobacillus tolerans]|uniref:Chemotaxis protein MotA n=2 Tax=Alicyclobacillus tolerans TaxID=90970 RepID=A0ABT9LY59_9BACL|nr:MULTISPECIES: flagellar motor protein [Alicyclobacillus]MDP9729204.1 chemotaxis protein MotA [Alicyclobacillus tengchongensis]QRF22650.1 flagellar motor protein [Alicyclobacillus sp. TC]SHK03895.1 chemotaxis protein MotA [Alicyclobacillus montanus]
MDIATLAGIIIAVVGLVGGFMLDGGSFTALLQPNAALIVFGGTLGATLTSSSLKTFLRIGKYLKIAFLSKKIDYLDVIEQLVNLATIARREGILALEDRVESFPDQFLRDGIRLVVDGVDPELVKNMMETELSYVEQRHEIGAKMFEAAGGFAPTMGIIGTVMGLIHVLGSLQDVSKLGPQIATAFTATLYGVASANVFWLPIANKLKHRNEDEILLREIMMEGVLSIQAGENPTILGQKLKAFLPPADRIESSKGKTGEVNAETAQA